MLTLFDHNKSRAHSQQFACRGNAVSRSREQLGLIEVEYQSINRLEKLIKIAASNIDPEVHGVSDRKHAIGKAPQQFELVPRMHVGKEHKS